MRPDQLFPLFADILSLDGVGPKVARLIERAAGKRVIDLIWCLPHGIVDRRFRPKIADAPDGQLCTLDVLVEGHFPPAVPSRPYRILASDETGTINLIFFRVQGDWLEKALPVGENRLISGEVKHYGGMIHVITTKGNPFGHLVLRGGERPNYDSASIALAESWIGKAGLEQSLLVDCSHANSGKKHELQLSVWENILKQKKEGNKSIVGVMIESNLYCGNQPFPEDPDKLRYGVSITDECLSWEESERMLREGAAVMHKLLH